MAMTFEYLLEDLQKRGMGIQSGKTEKSKTKALQFKQYALDNGEKVHVILDERKNWAVITDSNFQSVDNAWKKRGLPGLKFY